MTKPGSGQGPWILVQPERLERWLDRFREDHPGTVITLSPTGALLAAPGAVQAELRLPFPPLSQSSDDAYRALVEHVLEVRRVGVLLVRLGGHAAGVFEGKRLVASKVGARHVHGRSSAGGWSQQRFARRREGEVRLALRAAADVAAAVLLPRADDLDAVIVGGDRRAVQTVLEDRRLVDIAALVTEPHLDVPDPRLRILEQAQRRFCAARVRIVHGPPM